MVLDSQGIHVFLVCFLLGFFVYVCVCLFSLLHSSNYMYISYTYIIYRIVRVSLVDPCMHLPSQIQQRMQIQQSVNNFQIQIKNNPDSPTQRNPLNRTLRSFKLTWPLGLPHQCFSVMPRCFVFYHVFSYHWAGIRI